MRRNPKTEAEVRQLLMRWGASLPAGMKPKFDNMIAFLDADPTTASAFFQAVSAKIDKIEAKKAAAAASAKAEEEARKAQEAASVPVTVPAPSSSSGPLTDREAWTMLAELVDQVLTDLTAEERAAIKTAFLEEAAKAA